MFPKHGSFPTNHEHLGEFILHPMVHLWPKMWSASSSMHNPWFGVNLLYDKYILNKLKLYTYVSVYD